MWFTIYQYSTLSGYNIGFNFCFSFCCHTFLCLLLCPAFLDLLKIFYQAAVGDTAPRASHPFSILSCSHCVIPTRAVAEQEYHYPQPPSSQFGSQPNSQPGVNRSVKLTIMANRLKCSTLIAPTLGTYLIKGIELSKSIS